MSQNFELLRQLEAEFSFAGVIPEESRLVAKPTEDTNGRFSEELLTLAQTVFLSGDANAAHTVVFCGIDRDSASSDICINVGRILAASNTRPVCLVNAHLGPSQMERILGIDETPAFSGRIQDHCREVAQHLWIADNYLVGVPNQVGLASAFDVKQRLTDLRHRFDFVLIDAPGANIRGEAAIFGQLSDGTILVIEANVTRKAAALKAMRTIEAMNIRILGSVLNNRTFPIPERLYKKL